MKYTSAVLLGMAGSVVVGWACGLVHSNEATGAAFALLALAFIARLFR